ncbi:putative uncharacterized protein DDB_G0282133 isoform X9 [Plodia interpunctella]|uniref:putative uncharacterized protein DDB_G0282133 isoform X9 n=1 Tax=Plodia interpunctella TaxID=58824 RepID=UPI0023688478|nr:putative uncharacterized protein DDB_G0282133 isoform X9 [Plodia interpunctella]
MSSVSKISLLVLHVPFVSQVTVASQVTVVKMPCGIPISFRRKKGKRHLQQQQSKSSRSRSPSPEPAPAPSSDTFRPIPRTPPPTRVGPPPSPPVPTHPVAPVAPEPSGPQTLQPCSICNRTFLPQSLSKHEKICEKMTVKKRKTFDSSRQRREGTDLEQYLPKNFGLPENSPFLEKSPPNTAKATPKPKPQSVRTAITKPTSELQKCPHCSRAFGPRAFERHVEWCGDKAKILPGAGAQPPRLQDAKQRLNARTQYKAPPVRGRRSSQTRDKSSNSRSASVESSRGVSPPLPREYGDYRTSRTRASESQSSGEQCEPAHVPLLRPARHSLRSSGDAVRARQARLARDLSSSRLDDNYDPFVSAARQMKELMSSDTNIPKKIQNASKDPNRTLPILRPAKEKTPSSYLRTDNTKMMKDTLNKTYQKTPTLQRMKSFGSTNNENTNNTIGSRCSSFRLNRNDKRSSQSKLNTTFTKSSKENVGTVDKNYFNRNSSLNRSFSSYTTSNYSTPKPKDKIPKITTSMYHSFQRTTIKQPVKLDKINRDDEVKKNFVNLDVILTDDNSSMTDSNYIDPRLINENDNLPINVNTILNNPDIISSMESLLTTENLPAKFESFNTNNKINNNDSNDIIESKFMSKKLESNNNNNIKSTAPTIDDLSAQYDKIMSSLEQSIASKTSIRDDDSLCEDFDLEEFMTSFDDEINKEKTEKRTCSSTTRVVKRSELADSNKVSEMNSICSSPVVKSSSNGMIPVNKSMSLNFSSNNVSESIFPSSVKRSTSLLDSIQKKNSQKQDSAKSRKKADQLEQDLMQSLKDFDKFYESERHENKSSKDMVNYNTPSHNGTTKRDSRVKMDRINRKDNVSNGNYTPNGKVSNDSAYSRLVSLNRISPSKLSLCNSKEPNGLTSLEQIPAGSESGSGSSEEFLAMERSAELDDHAPYKEDTHAEKRVSSRASSRRSPEAWRRSGQLSSSGSETSLQRDRDRVSRLSRFCHECGNKFPVDSAKFCIQCGVKRLRV